MSRTKSFFKTAGIYFLGNAFTKLVSFFLLPLYTNKIDPASYGEYNLIISIINIVVPVCFLSIWDSVFRFSFDYESEDGKNKAFKIGLPMMLIGTLLIVAITIPTYFVFGYKYPLLVCLYAIMSAYQYYYTVLARSLKHNGLFVASGCANSLISILINIVLIVVFHRGIESFYISYSIGVVVQLLIIEIRDHFLVRLIKTKREKGIKQYFKFSIPVTLSSISNWLLVGLTQVFITSILGKYFNGLYSVAGKFSTVLVLGVGVFQFAWNETAYDLSREEDKMCKYKSGIDSILKVSILITAIVIPLVKILYPFMVDKQYHESLQIVPILLFGTMANCYASFLGTVFLAEKKSSVILYTTIFAGIVNVGLEFLLIRQFQLIGATMSLSISYLLFAVIRMTLLKKLYNISPNIMCIFLIVLIAYSVFAFYFTDSIKALLSVEFIVCSASIFILKDYLLALLKYAKKLFSRKKAETFQK